MRNKKLLSVSMVFALLASFLLLFGASRPLPLTVQASQGASEPDFSLMFIENVGQFNEQARFRVDGGPGTLWLTGDALWLTISERSQVELSPEDMRAKFEERLPIAEPHQVVNMKLSFAGANPRPRLEPFNRLETTINYYLGNDPARWRTSVPVWGGMRYVDFYPGLDLEITSEGGQWAWRLVCREADCQASLREVRLQVAGVEGVELLSAPGGENGGGVRLNTALGNITLPLLTIEGGGPASQPASTRTTNGVFEIAAPFSAVVPGAKAAIQPSASAEVFFGTYLGGSDADKVLDIAIAGQGDILDGTRAIYVTGYTESSDFLVQPPGSSLLQGDMDVFVTKVRKVGATISPEYSTYIGGSYTNAAYQDKGAEKGYGIAVDENEAVYVTGSTRSDDFPTTSGAFDTTFNGEDPCGPFSPDRACSDAFILKLDSSGALAYSTYLGGTGTDRPGSSTRGSGDDTGTAIAVQNGDIYITGSTWAEDFPTTAGAYDQTFSHVDAGDNDDVFVVKLRPAGNGSADLLYSSFVGSASIERGYDIAVDGGGIVYVTGLAMGESEHGTFPTTPGAIDGQIELGGSDAFLFKLNPAGKGSADLIYSTLLGGDDPDKGHGIALDAAGMVYITGETGSADFLTTSGAYDRTCGSDSNCNNASDAFVSKIDPAGNGTADLLYSTYLGGNNYDNFLANGDIALGPAGDVYLTGRTKSPDFPATSDAFDATQSGYDAFVVRMRLQGNGTGDLVYGTYLGGTGGSTDEEGRAITVDEDGRVYVAGSTDTTDFPVQNEFDSVVTGGEPDGFIVRLLTNTAPDLSSSAKTVEPDVAFTGQVVTFTVNLANSGILSATTAFTDTLPTTLILQGSPTSSSDGAPVVSGQTITWAGTVTAGTTVTITYATLLTSTTTITPIIFNQAQINDGQGNVYTRFAIVNGYKVFLPIILK